MKRLWIAGAVLLLIMPADARAETADFLRATVTQVYRSQVCSGWEDAECKAVFLIKGKNFLNSNERGGVKVENEWAEILRWTDTAIVAAASENLLNGTPIVSVDTTIHRPVLYSGDGVLDQMFSESVDVVLSSIKTNKDGFRYLTAGPKYSDPERTYYRDSYWTSGLVLMMEPYVVRDQIVLLARGIESNGSVPSAIPIDPEDVKIPLWLDHVDSGPYFIMMVHDYVRWTGDASILTERVNGTKIFDSMKAIISHLASKDEDGDSLPEKPKNSLQDWLDTIPRSGEVLSNEVLYYQALRNLTELSSLQGDSQYATSLHRQSLLVRYAINKQFWNEKKGYYYESCYQTVCVNRLTNESALAILFNVAPEDRRERLFKSLRQLETSVNEDIPHGNWGVVNAWPLYDGFRAHEYQNGTDWPFLDGINAGARLKYKNTDWHYPLTRWWIYNLEKHSSRVLPEYVSPLDKTGAGDRQAWSVYPAVAFVRYGLGIDPDMDGAYHPDSILKNPVRLENIFLRGVRSALDL